MRLTTKGRYGVRAVVNLAAAVGNEPISISYIAKKEQLSPEFLEQIFFRLKKAGLIRSVRGPKGGFVLNHKPSEISVKTILDAVGEPLFPAPCVDHGSQGLPARGRLPDLPHLAGLLRADAQVPVRHQPQGHRGEQENPRRPVRRALSPPPMRLFRILPSPSTIYAPIALPSAPAGLRAGISLRAAGDLRLGSAAREPFFRALGLPQESVFACRQVHSRRVLPLRGKTPGEAAEVEADGLAADAAEGILSVTVADCLPIFVYDRRGGAFALLHSGWQGTGIVTEGVRVLCREYGVRSPGPWWRSWARASGPAATPWIPAGRSCSSGSSAGRRCAAPPTGAPTWTCAPPTRPCWRRPACGKCTRSRSAPPARASCSLSGGTGPASGAWRHS